MQYAYDLGGGQAVIKKYKMAAAIIAGVIVIDAASSATGLSTSTTTGWADSVGLTLDVGLFAGAPAAYSTTQGDPESTQSVIVNPFAVFRALMVSSAGNAQLGNNTIGTATASGLTAIGTTGDQDPSSPSMDEGMIWYTTGSNASQSRKITSVTTTLTTTVIVPFAANALGDTYCMMPYFVGNNAGVTMSTNLLNVRCDLAPTGAAAIAVDQELNGRSNSYLHLMQNDNLFNGTLT